MVTIPVNVRIEAAVLDRIKDIARTRNMPYSWLIKEKMEELITNDCDDETKRKAIKIVEELRLPFAYVKSPTGRKHAKKEREIRDMICDKLERSFNLNGKRFNHKVM